MDVSVVLADDVLPPTDTPDTFILVGQRTVTGKSDGAEPTRCIVFDAIPCADMDVIMEQVECLEQVLPCGIVVLGVFLPGDGAKELVSMRRFLKNHSQLSALFAVTRGVEERKVQCQLLHSAKELPVTTLETRPLFVTMACYFAFPLGLFPFIVRSKDANVNHSVALDVTSTALLERSDVWNLAEELYAVQLGSKGVQKKMMCVHVTFAPLFSCGQDVYRAIGSLLPKVAQKPHGVMVRVESQRYPTLLYQWIFTPAKRGTTTLSLQQWNELRELIEDGVGEEVQSSQVVTDTLLGSPPTPTGTANNRKIDTAKKREAEVPATDPAQGDEKERSPLLRYIPSFLVVLCALVWVFLWSK